MTQENLLSSMLRALLEIGHRELATLRGFWRGQHANRVSQHRLHTTRYEDLCM